MRSIMWEGLHWRGKIAIQICCQLLPGLDKSFPTGYKYNLGTRGKLPGTLCSKLTFLGVLGRTLFIGMRLVQMFFL